ncbi:MAG: putative Ig domain-containing protein, partial [Cardiobacteriaceae bacterium]|nr:putative Ig domain-containing protein [Cardiobacteriaceae bacterium]
MTAPSANEVISDLQNKIKGLDYRNPVHQQKIIAYLNEAVQQVSVSSPGGGKITVLYSGQVNGDSAAGIANKLAGHSDVRILDKTEAYKLLNHIDFKDIRAQALGYSNNDALNDFINKHYPKGADGKRPSTYYNSPESRFEFDGKDGLWAKISKRFVAETDGEIRVMLGTPVRPDSVFNATELEEILEQIESGNTKITKVSGIEIDDLRAIAKNVSREELGAAIKAVAITHSKISHISEKNLDDFLKPIDDDVLERALRDPDLQRSALGLDENGSSFFKLSPKTAAILKKAGIAGLVVSFASVSAEAKAAEARGEPERAKEIMIEWAVGEVGSEVASTAAGILARLATVGLLGLSGPVAAVAGIAVTIVAGIYGEDFAKELYQIIKDIDTKKVTDLFDRMATFAFGQDFQPQEIPEALRDGAVALHAEMPIAELVEKAKTDIAYRYALRELMPVVAEGAKPEDFAPFNQDGTLDLFDADHPQGMTESYIRDRAAMLVLQMRYLKNGLKLNRDLVDDLVQGDWDYMDYAQHPFAGDVDRPLEFSIDGNGVTTDNHRIVFGSGKEDVLEGGGRDDRLYGAGGRDTLDGKDGSDYLEGGEGKDIYVLSSQHEGVDTIFDSDGKGILHVDGKDYHDLQFKPLETAVMDGNAGKNYYTADRQFRFSEMENSYWELAIDKGKGYKAIACIQNWKPGMLGVKIEKGGSGIEPDSSFFDLDRSRSSTFERYIGDYSPKGIRIRGNWRTATFSGSLHDDVIFTGDGNANFVDAKLGNDYIRAGSARDFIIAGANLPNSEKDDDTVYGGSDTDIIRGGGGNDTLWADDGTDSYEKPVVATNARDRRGDWISGQYGSDSIYGSAKEDILFGGEGNDAIRGGAGNDLILGDANYTAIDQKRPIGSGLAYVWTEQGKISGPRHPEDSTILVINAANYNWEWNASEKDYNLKPGLGFADDERVQGTGDDTLYGGDGNDWIAGQAGADTLYGDAGDDVLYGGDAVALSGEFADGKDRLYAGAGKDILYGGADDDRLDAHEDDNDQDKLYGEASDDELIGGTGKDELDGGEGNDTLRAGTDDTRMQGGSGNDTYHSSTGHDIMTDESGDDVYHLSSGNDVITDQGGYDIYLTSFGHLALPGKTVVKDSDGKGKILHNGRVLDVQRVRAVAESEWLTTDGSARLQKDSNHLLITNAILGSQGSILIENFFSQQSFLGLALPEYKTPEDPTLEDPQNPQPPSSGTPLAAQHIDEKQPLSYTVPDNAFQSGKDDPLSYSAQLADGKPLPAWLTFDSATRTFSGTPGNDDVGTLSIDIRAKGKGGSASQRLTLNIANVNDAPQAGETLLDVQAERGKPLSHTLPANAFVDIDKGDTLTLSATLDNGDPLPAWLSFDAAQAHFVGTPPADAQALYRIIVTATDKMGASVSQ